MAHFIGRLKGKSNKTITRLGEKTYGIYADINGLNTGISIKAEYDPKLCGDKFLIYGTEGSKAEVSSRLGSFFRDPVTGNYIFEITWRGTILNSSHRKLDSQSD